MSLDCGICREPKILILEAESTNVRNEYFGLIQNKKGGTVMLIFAYKNLRQENGIVMDAERFWALFVCCTRFCIFCVAMRR